MRLVAPALFRGSLVVVVGLALVACSSLDKKPKHYDGFRISETKSERAAVVVRDTDSAPAEAAPAGLLHKPSGQNLFKVTVPSGTGVLEGIPANDVLVVGSWNIKWFGSKSPDIYDFVTMADFIEECQVVAIQEVQGPNHKQVIDGILGVARRRLSHCAISVGLVVVVLSSSSAATARTTLSPVGKGDRLSEGKPTLVEIGPRRPLPSTSAQSGPRERHSYTVARDATHGKDSGHAGGTTNFAPE